MLVLSRKVGESIFINKSIQITVVQVANGRIRLGIKAPRKVKVRREELSGNNSKSAPSESGKVDALASITQKP